MQMPNCFGYLSIFVDACENLVMVDDVNMPSNPTVALVEKEELEETPFDANVFQRLCKEKPSRKNGAHSSQSFGMGSLIIS